MTVASSFCFWCFKVDFTSDGTRCEDLQDLTSPLQCLTYFTFYIFSQSDECFPVVGLQGDFLEYGEPFPDYKYIYNAPDLDELYDLASDPHELVNRIDDPAYSSIAGEGRRRLLQWIQDTDDPIRFAARFMLGQYG